MESRSVPPSDGSNAPRGVTEVIWNVCAQLKNLL